MLYLLFCCFLCSRLVQNNIGMCLALSYLNAFSLEFASFSVILLKTHCTATQDTILLSVNKQDEIFHRYLFRLHFILH